LIQHGKPQSDALDISQYAVDRLVERQTLPQSRAHGKTTAEMTVRKTRSMRLRKINELQAFGP